MAGEESSHRDVGDEPMQYYSKFQDVVVAVDENRVKGIQNLMKHHPELNAVLLDDAFQHRRVKPGLTILLTDYHHLYTNDMMLPSGMLREPVSGAKRADIIVVTKTPEIFSPITKRQLLEELRPKPYQHVFFSYIGYDAPVKLTAAYKPKTPGNYNTILLLAGIANPYPLEYYLRSFAEEVITMKYPDHYPYTQEDVLQVRKSYEDLFTRRKVIITTEKDAMRLQSNNLLSLLEGIPIAYIPVRVKFHNTDQEKFDRIILNYVEKDLRGHIISAKQGQ
jgi:tetraacyldisaccharide 4'-kinase